MFRIKNVVNEVTGEKYFISRATLTEEMPDNTPDGANWYEVEADPYDENGIPTGKLDLIVWNGDPQEIHITRGLDSSRRELPSEKPNHIQTNTVVARLDGDTLFVPEDGVISLPKQVAPELDFSRWQPKPEDEEAILLELHENVVGTADNCGRDGKEVAEALELYTKVIKGGLEACKEDVQDFFADMYRAVSGEIDKYYGDYPKIIELIKLTIAPAKYRED